MRGSFGLVVLACVWAGCGDPPEAEAPVTEAPATEAPATDAGATEAPPTGAVAGEQPADDACTRAVINKGALMTASGNGNLGADSRAQAIEACRSTPWPEATVACLTAATTWEQVQACEAAAPSP